MESLEEKFNVKELTMADAYETKGGISIGSGLWEDLAYLAGVTVRACVIFGKEGGRNAGLCVR